MLLVYFILYKLFNLFQYQVQSMYISFKFDFLENFDHEKEVK